MTATIFEAKSKLSELLKLAQSGERVVITSGREKKPIAELVAIEPKQPKRIGCLEGLMEDIPASFFEPLPGEWSGLKSGPDDPTTWSVEHIQEVNSLADKKWKQELEGHGKGRER